MLSPALKSKCSICDLLNHANVILLKKLWDTMLLIYMASSKEPVGWDLEIDLFTNSEVLHFGLTPASKEDPRESLTLKIIIINNQNQKNLLEESHSTCSRNLRFIFQGHLIIDSLEINFFMYKLMITDHRSFCLFLWLITEIWDLHIFLILHDTKEP